MKVHERAIRVCPTYRLGELGVAHQVENFLTLESDQPNASIDIRKVDLDLVNR